MFGTDAFANEQISEDEDWGPTKRKRRGKESDAASTLMTLCVNEKKGATENTRKVEGDLSSRKTKRTLFRLPPAAVEVVQISTSATSLTFRSCCLFIILNMSFCIYVQKLRIVFAENELPERAIRENLSRQLGLEFEKVILHVKVPFTRRSVCKRKFRSRFGQLIFVSV